MFSVDSTLCDIIKPILPLTKALNTSVSASKKHGTVQLSQFNIDQQILFFHQIKEQDVKEATRFSIQSDRLVALLHNRKTKVNLSYDGRALNYSANKSKGVVETLSYETYERPDIKPDKVLTKLVRKYFNLISLKSVVENTECFLFIEEQLDYTSLTVTDTCGYHAVCIKVKTKNKTISKLAIPFLYVQNAIRILKEDIQICSDEANLYCYTKSKEKVSIIRFRNLIASDTVKDTHIKEAIADNNTLSFETSADSLDSILNDYKVIKDKENSGTIIATTEDKKLNLRVETRHGYGESQLKIKDDIKLKFILPVSLLEDCLRIKEGTVFMGLKENHNIFYIKQSTEDIEINYFLAAEKITDEIEQLI